MKPVTLAVVASIMLTLGACAANDAESSGPVASVSQVAGDEVFKGAWLDTPYSIPSANFVDTEGNQVVWPQDGLPKPVTIVFFGYTNCDDGFCQTQTANAAAVVRGLPDELRDKVGIVFITSDPTRDTGPVLRKWLNLYGEDIVGLTGDIEVIQAAGMALGVQVDNPPSPIPAEGYAVGHGTQLIGFGPKGTAPVLWLPETPIADIRADIETLLNGNW